LLLLHALLQTCF